jgi:integrase
LSDEEIGLLWRACDTVNPAYSACLRLIFLTGCRRNEAAQARWAEFDLDAGTWSLPAARSKNKRAHVTDLPQQAIDLLVTLPCSGPFVFSTTGGAKPLGGFSKVRRVLQATMVKEAAKLKLASPVDDWVFHDIRRSLVSWLAANGVAIHVADRLLNHVSGSLGGVVGIYQRYQFVPERRAALAAWGNHVASLASGAPAPSNVVTLHAAA